MKLVEFALESDDPTVRSTVSEVKAPVQLVVPKSWNKVRLAVVGDRVKLALNGTEVYERAIEPTNQRFFGLFHYTDRTEARVRGTTLTGDWPKALPPNDKLFEKK